MSRSAKPAYVGENGYRYYEEAQLLKLQQILFYRELGLELKEIKRILGQTDFKIASALQSHRKVLQTRIARVGQLLETIDKTIEHLKGKTKMKSEEMFVGFHVGKGDDRHGERIKLGGISPHDCKVSAKDTGGAMAVFEFTGPGGGPNICIASRMNGFTSLKGRLSLSSGRSALRHRQVKAFLSRAKFRMSGRARMEIPRE